MKSLASAAVAIVITNLIACGSDDAASSVGSKQRVGDEAPPAGGATDPAPAGGSSAPTTADAGSLQRGACLNDGKCSPEVVVSGLYKVSAVAVSSSGVWAIDSSSNLVRAANGSSTKVFAQGSSPNARLAAIDDTAFWSASSSLNSYGPSGPRPADLTFAKTSPDDFVVRDGKLLVRINYEVFSVTKYGYQGGGWPLYSPSIKNGARPTGMTVDTDGTLYWTDADVGTGLHLYRLNGNEPIDLGFIEGGDKAFGLVATKTHIVFHDYSHRCIVAFPKLSGAKVMVAEKDEDAFQFAADDDGVYWLAWKGVMAANADGTNARVLVPNVHGGGIAADADHIYFGDGDSVKVIKK